MPWFLPVDGVSAWVLLEQFSTRAVVLVLVPGCCSLLIAASGTNLRRNTELVRCISHTDLKETSAQRQHTTMELTTDVVHSAMIRKNQLGNHQ